MKLTSEGVAWETLPPRVLVYAIDRPFFLGTVDTFEHTLAQLHTDPAVLILRLCRVPFIDRTGIFRLEDVIAALKKRDVRVILCDANARVKEKLIKAGILDLIGDGNYAETLALALSCCRMTPEYEMYPSLLQKIEQRHEYPYRVTTRRFIRTSRQYFWGEKEP